MNELTSNTYKNYSCTWEKSEPKIDAMDPVQDDRALLVLFIYNRSDSTIKDKFAKVENSMKKKNLACRKPRIC